MTNANATLRRHVRVLVSSPVPDSKLIGYIEPREDDDLGFLDVAAAIVESMDMEGDRGVDHLIIVRVKNWFDHKWLGFSGKGRVPFDSSLRGHPGVALDEFRQDKLTFPPFTPRRILEQYTLIQSVDAKKLRGKVHPRVLQNSSANLQRRVEHFSDSMLAFWISTNTTANAKGSFMVYRSVEGSVDAWYASFRRDSSRWLLDRVKGADRTTVEALMAR